MGTITAKTKKNGVATFRAEVRMEGVRVTKRFARKTDAQRWVTTTESAIITGSFTPPFKKYTVADAIDRYLKEVLPSRRERTQELYERQLLWFRSRIGHVKLHQLTSAMLADLREQLRVEPVLRRGTKTPVQRGPSTANRYFNPLLSCLRLCNRDWGWMAAVPHVRRYPEPTGRTRYLTPKEAQAVLDELEKEPRRDFRLVCLISLTLGSRLEETCALRWEEIDFERQVILFTRTKNGLVKGVPVPSKLFQELCDWRATQRSEYLFPTTRPSKRPYIYDSVKKRFKRIALRLGLEKVSYHNIRHTVGSWATQDGANRRTVAEVLGHRDLKTTDRYSHLDVEHLRPALEKVEARLQSDRAAANIRADESS